MGSFPTRASAFMAARTLSQASGYTHDVIATIDSYTPELSTMDIEMIAKLQAGQPFGGQGAYNLLARGLVHAVGVGDTYRMQLTDDGLEAVRLANVTTPSP
jgi:hypothetical protein